VLLHIYRSVPAGSQGKFNSLAIDMGKKRTRMKIEDYLIPTDNYVDIK
jgi:hypothetical protein